MTRLCYCLACLPGNLICYLICYLVCCPSALLGADSWPGFRGPRGDGHAPAADLPLQWSATKNVTWSQPIPGEGWSSPVVKAGHVYLTAAVPIDESEDYSLRLISLRTDTGQVTESIEVFRQLASTAPKIHFKNGHASPTPLIEDGKIYVHFGHQGTACLDLRGNILWRNRMSYAPVHGNGGSPVLVGDALIFSCDGSEEPFVVALDKQSGKVLWKTPRQTDAVKTFSFSTPTAIDVNGQRQVISPGSNAVCALDPQTGREIWRVTYDGYSVVPKPIYGHGLVFVCTGWSPPKLLAIRPDGQGDVTATHVEWRTDRRVPNTPSPLLVDQALYMVADNGVATCLDASGGKVHWQKRLGGTYSASPLYVGGKIYFQSEQGDTTVIEAATRFRKLGESSLGQRTFASYAIADGALFLRSDSHLHRIE